MLRLGWAPAQIQAGDNHRHRHPEGRQVESLPCHPDTLRDAFRRVEAAAWLRVQEAGRRRPVSTANSSGARSTRSTAAAWATTSAWSAWSASRRQRPVIVAWRLLEGAASEKGREAEVTRELIEQALELGGPECIELLLADALYADGPLIAWLAYAKGIDVLTPLPSDRRMFADALGLARGGSLAWTRHRYVRTIRGHKQARTVEVAAVGEMTSWDSFVEAARGYGVRRPEPVGGPGPRDRAAGAGVGGLLGVGEHAAVRRRLRGLAGVPPALAHRERRLSRAEGGLRPGGAAVGPRRGGGPLPHRR